jgi:hypothetical protein
MSVLDKGGSGIAHVEQTEREHLLKVRSVDLSIY